METTDHHIHFRYQIHPVRDIIRIIRDKVETSLLLYPEELRDACRITVSELIENAVKYGTAIDKNLGITFDFTVDDRCIAIVVVNKIYDQKDYEAFRQHLDQIQASENPKELYYQRLQFLLDHPEQDRAQLGLLRIAYEGKFVLNYYYNKNDGVVTITAVRMIATTS